MSALTRSLALLVMVLPTGLAAAGTDTKGLAVEQPWCRATPQGATVGACYVKISNSGKEDDILTGAAFDASQSVEIHEMRMDGDKMIMRAVKVGVVIKPGETVTLAPGGVHLMLMGLKEPVAAGSTHKGALTFAKAGNVDVEFKIEGLGAMSPGQH